MSHPVIVPKKLIEIAIPLDAINEANAREKSIRHGHPSTLHLYWARRPLAAARAVIFAQMVNDPSWRWEIDHPLQQPSPQQRAAWTKARRRLFEIMEKLVQWESTTDKEILEQAHAEIRKSWRETCEVNRLHPQARHLFDPDELPAFHDPFAGGGAIPLEAQRLGLDSYASDLNPLAVVINKAMIEVPPRFGGLRPVNPSVRSATDSWSRDWSGLEGLAEDVRYYGEWMRDEARHRIGHLYPTVSVSSEMARKRPELTPYVGDDLTVIAWIWARTVRSPNPAFSDVHVPLISSFLLSGKPGKEAYLEPVIDGRNYRFRVTVGVPPNVERTKKGTKSTKGATFVCLMSNTPIDGDYIKAEGCAGRFGARLMAVVAEGKRGRVYLEPTPDQEEAARIATPSWKPTVEIAKRMTGGNCTPYGLTTFGDLFTARQLTALTTFSDLVGAGIDTAKRDAIAAGRAEDGLSLADGGSGATAYAEAVGMYLAFQVDQLSNHLSTICAWHVNNEQLKNTFARQSLPMVWDYAETNPFSSSTGSLGNLQERQVKGILSLIPRGRGAALQADAATQNLTEGKVVSTDPPYYDNIGYADLSDFFYVWLRRSLKGVFPELFATLAVPKAEELVATVGRHGSRDKAEAFFLEGMTQAMHRLAECAHPAYPVTIYYAFKQSESDSEEGTSSTGWETFLDAVIRAGFALTGTWPMRTEQTAAMKTGTNALASSIVLVCRKRPLDAPVATRRDFTRALSALIPQALQDMTTGANGWGSPVAPVDLSQAIIGPGMGLFTQYAAVLEADGKPMTVRTALQLINRYLADDDFDADTRFCLAWYEQYGFGAGPYGDAETLAKAKGTSVGGVQEAGVLRSAGGRVELTRWSEYPEVWNPASDSRIPVWEVVHHLIRALSNMGDAAAGRLLAQVQSKAGASRQLAYRLFTLCERAGRAEDARAYNDLITGWPAIEAAMAASVSAPTPELTLFDSPE